ncbi:hydroxymethylglutaryl-lyase [Exophiala viscosa]|uniref:hydroxymethylglutaryl-lyase n=1 Tax=Exophiala viscosa TaxID=2486360 RepID=UPI0021A1005D|nr:hydroxymethylglutaryl-lyase [Exophiala viscosa]
MRTTPHHCQLWRASTVIGRFCKCPQARPWFCAISARNASSNVRIIEVGPRDGLQNISTRVPTSTKVELIKKLAATGLKDIEATSFVSPKWVPQLADGREVMDQVLPLADRESLRFSVLAPNMKGFENALAAGAREIVVFASATEAFSKKNQNCTVEQALEAASVVVKRTKEHNIWVRGVVSCIFSDPYSGPTDPKDVASVVKRFMEMGCDEVGLGDTLGVGTPKLTQALLEVILKDVPADKLTGHFHDTYGQAIANVMRSYDMGLRAFDGSVAGLGGCPYAPGAKGNASTEDIVYTLENSGIDTGVNLQELAAVGEWIAQQLKLPNNSRAGAALMAKQRQTSVSSTGNGSKPEHLSEPATGRSQGQSNPSLSRTWTVLKKDEGYTASRAHSAVKITLTRPKNGNAMTTEMLESLTRLFKELSTDRSVFQIVLAAEGKFFCTGMDLTGGSRDDSSSYHDKIVALFESIDDAPQTTIAAIHGPCYGGGVGLGFACDVRLVSEAARWTLSEVKLGVSPAIISKYMAREWGFAFFREAMLSGREVTVQELSRIGTIHGIAQTQDKLNLMVEEYLDDLAHCAPQAAATCKELVRLAFKGPDSREQNAFVQHTFENMLAPDSEGQYGIQQFQQKVKKVDWRQYWNRREAKL